MFRRGDWVAIEKPEAVWRLAAVDAFFVGRCNVEIPRSGRVYLVLGVKADPRRPGEAFLELDGLTVGAAYRAAWFRPAPSPVRAPLPQRAADLPPDYAPRPLTREALATLRRPTAYAPPCARGPRR